MDMRAIINLLESYKKGDKIGRWAFIYLEPKKTTGETYNQFAQCSTCDLFLPGKKRCGIFGKNDVVVANASCGLYIQGQPHDDQPIQDVVTPDEAGYVIGQVRCENCSWYKKGKCELFAMLDDKMSDTFKLGADVDPKGCCNAWS
jgi:hypothetical protein